MLIDYYIFRIAIQTIVYLFTISWIFVDCEARIMVGPSAVVTDSCYMHNREVTATVA